MLLSARGAAAPTRTAGMDGSSRGAVQRRQPACSGRSKRAHMSSRLMTLMATSRPVTVSTLEKGGGGGGAAGFARVCIGHHAPGRPLPARLTLCARRRMSHAQ